MAVEVSWRVGVGRRAFCLALEDGAPALSDGHEVIRRASVLAGVPDPFLCAPVLETPPFPASAPAPPPAPAPAPPPHRGNFWEQLHHSVQHVIEKPPPGLVKGLVDLTKPLPRPPAPAPPPLKEVLKKGDTDGHLAEEAEKLFGVGENCVGRKQPDCTGDCEWHNRESRCGLGEDAAMALLAAAMENHSFPSGNGSTTAWGVDAAAGDDEITLMLSCSMRPKASCDGKCEWLPSDHAAAAAGLDVAAAAGADVAGEGGVCVMATFVDAAGVTAGPSKVIHLSAACAKNGKENCTGDCEWASGADKCEVEELLALGALGGSDFKNEGLVCRQADRAICPTRPGCGWQKDYARCSVHLDSVMGKMMRGQDTMTPPPVRRLQSAVSAGHLWGHRGDSEAPVLRLGGLFPDRPYVAYCALLARPAKICSTGERRATKECTSLAEPATLLQFPGGSTVWSAEFTSHAPSDGSNALGLATVLLLLLAAGIGGTFAFSNRKRLARRFWARRIALPEDSELMACPIGPDSGGWAELR